MASTAPTKSMTFDELVARESRRIAVDAIQTELEKAGLPLPKESSLEIHVDQLLRSKPEIKTLAIQRVEARADAHSEALRAIGLTLEVVKPVDIEL